MHYIVNISRLKNFHEFPCEIRGKFKAGVFGLIFCHEAGRYYRNIAGKYPENSIPIFRPVFHHRPENHKNTQKSVFHHRPENHGNTQKSLALFRPNF
jgi:hypothetical protein